ncbi:hypothetical protein GCM10010430_17300 [Kitasatospora cystarginea]|uniref:Uncharacterized protein n=1 Tax=Kitasatospora cystarginea TaxID=58350 RepID=A0ABN3DMV9_9ACTN
MVEVVSFIGTGFIGTGSYARHLPAGTGAPVLAVRRWDGAVVRLWGWTVPGPPEAGGSGSAGR